MATAPRATKKAFVSSIPLWFRTDQPRQAGVDYWKGPHSKIISATPGLEEYRQIHMAEHNPGMWPATPGVQTAIPADRRIDGVAEVTFASVLSTLRGRKQTKLAYQDEINVFRRTFLYAGPPSSARWYDVAGPDVAGPSEQVGARAMVYLRRRDGVRTGPFREHLNELASTLAGTGQLRRAADPGLPALEREALGHPERRARQPGRPAVPRVPDPRLRGPGGAGGLLRQRRAREPVRRAGPVRLRRARLRHDRRAHLREGRQGARPLRTMTTMSDDGAGHGGRMTAVSSAPTQQVSPRNEGGQPCHSPPSRSDGASGTSS